MNRDDSPADDTGSEIHISNRHIPVPEETIRAFCRKWKVRSFRLYGSVMRNDFRPDSDVDVMVDFHPGGETSFSGMFDMQEELEALFGRKVDLVDRRSLERSENYIRRKGIFSGKPPVLRQMSYLLDMLISARKIQECTKGKLPETVDTDEMAFHAISYNVRWLAVSANRVDEPTRRKYSGIPWDVFVSIFNAFEKDPFEPDTEQLKEIAWQTVPGIIPLLLMIVPPEDQIDHFS